MKQFLLLLEHTRWLVYGEHCQRDQHEVRNKLYLNYHNHFSRKHQSKEE
jgi:hypothetical protein